MGQKPERLSVDEQFDLLALFFTCRSNCDRLRTATVIRDKKNILIAAGYNGSLPGMPHCDDVGHLMVNNHCLRTNHGEENALLNCLDLDKIEGGVVTIVGSPCFPCARKLASKQPKRIRYIGTYDNAEGGSLVEELCKERGIVIEYVDARRVLSGLQKAIDFLQGPGGVLKDLPLRKMLFWNLEI